MALIAILISLVAERLLGSMEELRRFDWFLAYYRWAAVRLVAIKQLNGSVGVLLLLLPLIGPVVFLDYYLSGLWLLFGLAFAILILLYCFGPRDLEAEVEAFVDARTRDDEESACWHASELLGGKEVASSAEVTQRIMQNIFVEANERLLAIVFWFVLLGPGGALLYRLSSLFQQQSDQGDGVHEAGVRLHLLLAWLPARLCAVSYALAGSFVEALHGWRGTDSSWFESSRDILIASGFGALRIEPGEIEDDSRACEQINESMSLVRRAVLVFLSLIALSTLAGWMG
ncbi:MAG: regulatory signaling modulator protein AmpE [Pseudomonadota bacterium]